MFGHHAVSEVSKLCGLLYLKEKVFLILFFFCLLSSGILQFESSEESSPSSKSTKSSKLSSPAGSAILPVKPTKSSKPPVEPNKLSELMAKQKVNEKAKKWAFYLRQKNVTEKAAGIDSINIEVDKYDVKKPLKQQYWVNGLTETDRALLVSGRWLNDRLVNASQQLLSQQFLHLKRVARCGYGENFSFQN